ncbi:hypothetical protein GE21DRAFT_1136381 [Neurospora crassa]|nr:hypothetical protein GE21DRAFT_1136381 [Neurospora crassa]
MGLSTPRSSSRSACYLHRTMGSLGLPVNPHSSTWSAPFPSLLVRTGTLVMSPSRSLRIAAFDGRSYK